MFRAALILSLAVDGAAAGEDRFVAADGNSDLGLFSDKARSSAKPSRAPDRDARLRACAAPLLEATREAGWTFTRGRILVSAHSSPFSCISLGDRFCARRGGASEAEVFY